MFPFSGWGLGCLRLCLLRVWTGEATGRWACGTCQSRLYGSGGSQPEVSRSDPARGILKEWALLSQKLHVQTTGGKVICLGTVYGDIDIRASDKSTVTVDKLQGSSINISTEDGLLKVKYLYTESSFLSSAAGDITLGSVHDSSSGCLNALAQQGAIDVYVSELGKVELKVHKGSILVKVASSLQAYLQLSGKEIDMNSDVHVEEMNEAHRDDGVIITGFLNQTSKHEKWIKADAPKGTVRFRSQSWFQSLKLQD
uniref:Family with sequence similarity 185 member A n=1 Tax=Moschus moschiferus TaxID=68415 RepID=A0A8C6DVQ2_MOSMO